MLVNVKLFAYLRQYIPDSAALVSKGGLDLAEGTTVSDLLRALSLPEGLRVVVLVNGVHCQNNETGLKEGDTLFVYPMMSGG